MSSLYDKLDIALKELTRLQTLIRSGLARPSEKTEAFRIAKEAASSFTNDLFIRRAEKLSKRTVWSQDSKDGFVPAEEADQLNEWVELISEYIGGRKIKAELSSETVHIQSIVDGEDQHILVTEKGSGDHAHLILDGGTGEIRIDPKDKKPHDLIKGVQAQLELKTGETVQVTRTSLAFVDMEKPQADVRAYTANKDGYFVLELYNNGDEDLEEFQVYVNWLQLDGAKERQLTEFYYESDYLVMASHKSLNMLRKGERVYSHIPSISVGGDLNVTISCKGMRTGGVVKKSFKLQTASRYPDQ